MEVREIEPQTEREREGDDGKEPKLRVRKPAPKTGELSITIRVKKESPVGSGTYHIRSVKFIGNKEISDSELTAALGLQKGGHFDPKVFIQNVKRFNSTGRCKPIIEDDIEFQLGEEGDHDDATSGEMNLTIRIFEVRKD